MFTPKIVLKPQPQMAVQGLEWRPEARALLFSTTVKSCQFETDGVWNICYYLNLKPNSAEWLKNVLRFRPINNKNDPSSEADTK